MRKFYNNSSLKLVAAIVSIALLFFSNTTFAQPGYLFAQRSGAGTGDGGVSVAVDGLGNVYTTGFFRGTVDFDASASTFNLTSAGNEDVFVSKVDALGNFIWAQQLGGTSGDGGYAIALDNSGNAFITGYFQGTANFGATTLVSAGGLDAFVCELNSSNGSVAWARQTTGGTGLDVAYGIAVDASGNVYTSGIFSSTVDFDPSGSTYNLTTVGGNNGFLWKLDPTGNLVWAKRFGGGNTHAFGVAVNSLGDVFISGNFTGTGNFDPNGGTSSMTPSGGRDAFVCKLNSAGTFFWSKQVGGTGSTDYGYGITADASGNVYVTGTIDAAADFDPGAGTLTLTPAGGIDAFVWSLNGAGNFLWAGTIGGTGSDYGYSIALDAGNNVYTSGWFNGTADFDPSASSVTMVSAGSDDGFVSILNAASGNYVWAGRLGGTSSDISQGVSSDASGNVYATGTFNGTADFDPGVSTFNLSSAGGSDIFIVKLGTITLPIELLSFYGEDQGASNLLLWNTASEQNNDYFILERSEDGINFSPISTINSQALNGNSNTQLNYSYTDVLSSNNEQATQLYYRLKQIDFNGAHSYSKIISIAKKSSLDIVHVFPNPASDNFQCVINSFEDTNVNIIVVDMVGRTVITRSAVTVTKGSNNLNFNISTLAKGSYNIQVSSASGMYNVQKLIVQ